MHQAPDDVDSLDATRRALRLLAPLAQWGLVAVGVAMLYDRTAPFFADAQLTWGERRVLLIAGAVYALGFGLAGWVVGRLLRAAEELIGLVVDQSASARRTADLLEFHVSPALGRLAVALERAGTAPPADDGRQLAVAGVRQAIEAARWGQAERLLDDLRADFPSAADEADRLDRQIHEGRERTTTDLRARLDAARTANDPVGAIDFRDELTLHLQGDALRELDRDLVSWLFKLLQRRMRTGTFSVDAAQLAERVARSFGDTAEGASLRAALPTLRRSAGLCPRCGQAYTGLENACDTCTGAPPNGAPSPS